MVVQSDTRPRSGGRSSRLDKEALLRDSNESYHGEDEDYSQSGGRSSKLDKEALTAMNHITV